MGRQERSYVQCMTTTHPQRLSETAREVSESVGSRPLGIFRHDIIPPDRTPSMGRMDDGSPVSRNLVTTTGFASHLSPKGSDRFRSLDPSEGSDDFPLRPRSFGSCGGGKVVRFLKGLGLMCIAIGNRSTSNTHEVNASRLSAPADAEGHSEPQAH